MDSVIYTIFHAVGITFLTIAPRETMIVAYNPTIPTLPRELRLW